MSWENALDRNIYLARRHLGGSDNSHTDKIDDRIKLGLFRSFQTWESDICYSYVAS